MDCGNFESVARLHLAADGEDGDSLDPHRRPNGFRGIADEAELYLGGEVFLDRTRI